MEATVAETSERPADGHVSLHETTDKPSRKRISKGKGLRVRTGCLSCKARHLKCDEARPACRACQKSARECVYPPRERQIEASTTPVRREQISLETTETAQPSGSDEQLHQVAPNTQAQSEEHSSGETLAQDAGEREEHAIVSLGRNESQINEQLAHDILSAHSPQTLGYRANFPRHSSRITNQDCGETQAVYDAELFGLSPGSSLSGWPSISAEAASRWWFELLASDVTSNQLTGPARNISDEAHDPLSSTHNDQSHGYSLVEQTIDDAPFACRLDVSDGGEVVFSQLELELFQHFVSRLSGWIDTTDPDGHFAIVVPQMALRNQGLASAILALSARHLSLTSTHGSPMPLQVDQTLAVQYYNDTLSYLQREMDNETFLTSDELLAIVLIISTYEMIDEHGASWEKHLKGVFWIQRSQTIHGESVGLKKRIWWAWLRQDIWAAFRGRRRILSFYKVTRPCESLNFWDLVDRAIYILGQCVNYASTKEEQDGHGGLQRRLDHSVELRTKLDEWWVCFRKHNRRLPTASRANLAFEPIWINPPAASMR